ncbi:hypothetical protein EXIGLDRAFT_839615 [Exidia glandulosa HHB12029]|uniref:Uncharacterized protein n=1 Tax=Exidia glandulosa HHB12029 TaxID=1314781 RepID=A0A165EX20_EXIGL|nr:hypothetical protein EXIGLDRAFT_839615 [Exidia glandulosa HHB12029]
MARTAATNAMPAQQFYAARPIEPTPARAATSTLVPQGDAPMMHKKKTPPVLIPILRQHKPQAQEATLNSSARRALQRKGILSAKEVSPILSESDSESESFDDDDQLRFSSSLRPAGRKKKRGWYERDDEYRQSDTEDEEEYDPSNFNSKAHTDKRKRPRRQSRARHSATDMPPKGRRHAEPEEDAESDWALAHTEHEEPKDVEEEEADWALTPSPSRKRKRVHFEDPPEEGQEDEDESWTPKLRRRIR